MITWRHAAELLATSTNTNFSEFFLRLYLREFTLLRDGLIRDFLRLFNEPAGVPAYFSDPPPPKRFAGRRPFLFAPFLLSEDTKLCRYQRFLSAISVGNLKMHLSFRQRSIALLKCTTFLLPRK